MEKKELIGPNIRNIRKQLHMKQKELANNLNISSGYLSEIEAGKKSPGLEVVDSLLQKYNVNPAYLLTGMGDYFLNMKENKNEEQQTFTKKGDIYNAAIDEMLWYFKNIPFVGFAVLGFFKNFLHEKKDIIDAELKKIKEKNLEEEVL